MSVPIIETKKEIFSKFNPGMTLNMTAAFLLFSCSNLQKTPPFCSMSPKVFYFGDSNSIPSSITDVMYKVDN